MSYNVWVTTTGDNGSWSSNRVEYDTINDAIQAGRDLFMRWFAVENWAVIESDLFDGNIQTATVRIHAEHMNDRSE